MPFLQKDVFVPVRDENEEMTDAIREARESLKLFLRAFANPKPNQKDFQLKVSFEYQGECESVWVTDLDLNTKPATGSIASEPRLRSLMPRQRVEFTRSMVTDWMYLEDGRLVGGFTTKLEQRLQARRRMNKLAERLLWKRVM